MLSLLFLILPFYWLLYETYWLTIRLPVGKLPKQPNLIKYIPLIVGAGMIIYGLLRSFGSIDKQKHWYYIFKKLLPKKPRYPVNINFSTSNNK